MAQSENPPLWELRLERNPDSRVIAAAVLGYLGPQAKAAAPALRELSRQKAGRLRVVAAAALWQISPSQADEVIPILIDSLKDKDAGTRSTAAGFLGKIGPAAKIATPGLLVALKDITDENLWVRWRTAEALGRIDPEANAVIPALAERFKDEGECVRDAAADALRRLAPGSKTAAPALLQLFNDTDEKVRLLAIKTLGGIASKAEVAVPAVTGLLKDKDAGVRKNAAKVLRDMGPGAKAALPALTELFKDDYWSIRAIAATAAWKIGGPKAKEEAALALSDMLKDEDLSARCEAAGALGVIGPKAKITIPALTELLKDKELPVRDAAAEALGEIGPEAKCAAAALTELLDGENSPMAEYIVVKALGQMGPAAKSAIPALKNLYDRMSEYSKTAEAVAVAEAVKGSPFCSGTPFHVAMRDAAAEAMKKIEGTSPSQRHDSVGSANPARGASVARKATRGPSATSGGAASNAARKEAVAGFDSPESAFRAYATGAVTEDSDLMLSALTRESRAYHIGLAWMSLSYVFSPDECQQIMREHGSPALLAAFGSNETDTYGVRTASRGQVEFINVTLETKNPGKLFKRLYDRQKEAGRLWLKNEDVPSRKKGPTNKEILAAVALKNVKITNDTATGRIELHPPAEASDPKWGKEEVKLRRIKGRWYCDIDPR